jgi:hypothetical protein
VSGRERLALVLALVLAPVLVTWPVLPAFTEALPAAPDQEASAHLWGLWAALETGHPLILETDLLAWPTGTPMVLVDPGNLPWFALGSVLGPVAGYNAVVLAGAVLMAVAGALLAREAGGSPALGALLGAACPTALGHAAEGMTEGAGVGWVGIHLALLLAFRREGRPWQGALAVLSGAAAWYAGPYNGVWAALLGLGLAAGSLPGLRRGQWRPLARLAGAGAAAAALVAPLAHAVLTVRPPSQPGSADRAGLPRVHEWPDRFRGGLETGADLLDPLLPVVLTGGEAPVPHTAYLGIVLVSAAAWATLRDRRRWPWLAGAGVFALLSLGPWLYLAGRALRVGGGVVPGPAAALMLAVPGLARVTRWYRAGAVAGLLLAGLGSAAARRPASRVALGIVVVLDALLLSPLTWPLHRSALPDTAPYAALAEPGALVELPPATTGEPPPGRWRDRTVLAQALHGRAVGGGAMGVPPSDAARGAQGRLEGVMRGAGLPPRALQKTRAAGFRYLALYPEYRAVPAEARAHLERCFGAPVAASAEVWLFDLDAAPPQGCPAGGTAPPRH